MNSQIPPGLAMLLPDSFVTLSPEQSLLLAVLDRAVRDIIDFNQSKRCADNAAKRQAWTWLKSDNRASKYFTFVEICEDLNMDPNHIRRQIAKRINTPAFIACFEEASGHTRAAISALPRRGRLRSVQRNKMHKLERDQEELQQSITSGQETSDQLACVSSLCAVGKSR